MSDVDNFSQLADMIKTLQESLENKLPEIRVEMDCFRHKIKESLNFFKKQWQRSSLEEAWAQIDEFKEELIYTSKSKKHNNLKSMISRRR